MNVEPIIEREQTKGGNWSRQDKYARHAEKLSKIAQR